jgi:hypothetical protein
VHSEERESTSVFAADFVFDGVERLNQEVPRTVENFTREAEG